MNLIRRNIFWLLVSQAATWIASLATLVIVPNRLGSTDFGTYGYATGYVLFFTLIAGLGTSAFMARAIARDHDLVGPYVWNAVLLKVVLWAVLSAIAMALAYALGNRGQTLVIIAIGCAGMLPTILTEVFFGGALAGMQRMARPAMWMVVQVYFQTIFGILVLLLGWGVVAYAAVMAMGILIPTTATGLMVWPMVRGHRSFDFRIWRLLVVGGIPLLTLTSLNLIYGTVDVPILHNLVGSEPVGWYTVALRWVGIPAFITTAVVAAYFPAFSREGNPVTGEFVRLVNRAFHIVMFVTVPASVGLFFIADDMIRLVYDEGYDQAIVLVQILAFVIPLMGMDTVLATALIASHRLNRYLYIAAAAAVINPIACVIAIKITDERYGNGAIGAALVTVATELWVMGGALFLRSPGVVDRVEVGRIARILAAAATMAPLLLLSSGWPLAVQVGLGVVAYAVASLAFGGISVAEIRDEVRQIRQSRRGEWVGDESDQPDEPNKQRVEDGNDGELAPLPTTGDAPP